MLSLVPVPESGQLFAYPRIAPGAYIGRGCYICGAAWIDNAIIRHNTSVRADVLEGSQVYFDQEPAFERGKHPYSVIIGNATAIDDGCHLHPTADLNQPLVIGNDVLVGHNTMLHGRLIEDGATVFIDALASEGTIMRAGSILGAGAALSKGNVALNGDMIARGVDTGARIQDQRADHWDRAESSRQINILQAVRTLAKPDSVWGYLTERERTDLNLSKLLYSAEAACEVFAAKGMEDQVAPTRSLVENIERYFDLRDKEGISQDALKEAINVGISNLHQLLDKKVGVESVRIEDSKIRWGGSYLYDGLQLANITKFVGLCNQHGIEGLAQFNEYEKGTGIHGSWAYYGIDHRDQFPSQRVTNTPVTKLKGDDCLEVFCRQPKALRFFLASKRFYIDVLRFIPDLQEFKELTEVLDRMDTGGNVEDTAKAARLIGRAPQIFKDIAHLEGGETKYEEALSRYESITGEDSQFYRTSFPSVS